MKVPSPLWGRAREGGPPRETAIVLPADEVPSPQRAPTSPAANLGVVGDVYAALASSPGEGRVRFADMIVAAEPKKIRYREDVQTEDTSRTQHDHRE